MAGSGEIILHHYDASPFSEKARLMLGLKGLSWRSVITPNMMPKPDLTPLTGGYRRAPVMQVGADVWCDSQAILAEIARRAPDPPVATGPLGFPVNLWADRLFFQATVPVIFAELGDKVPAAFIADREKLSGRKFDIAAMQVAAKPMAGQWRAQAAWIEAGLAGADYLGGASAGLADIAAFMNLWFLQNAAPHLAKDLTRGLPRLAAWGERMAAIGHGQRTEMTGAEALQVARQGQPAAAGSHDRDDPLGLEPGAPISVSADDYGRDPVVGELVAANAGEVVVAQETAGLGRIHIHFPRAGYIVGPAA